MIANTLAAGGKVEGLPDSQVRYMSILLVHERGSAMHHKLAVPAAIVGDFARHLQCQQTWQSNL